MAARVPMLPAAPCTRSESCLLSITAASGGGAGLPAPESGAGTCETSCPGLLQVPAAMTSCVPVSGHADILAYSRPGPVLLIWYGAAWRVPDPVAPVPADTAPGQNARANLPTAGRGIAAPGRAAAF